MGVKFIGLEPCPAFDNRIPECPHGPMLLFERADSGGGSKAGRQFYACSACRDRKQCAFFLWRDERLSAAQARRWRERVAGAPFAAGDHSSRFLRAQAILTAGGRYCLDCNQLVAESEAVEHRDHETRLADLTSSARPTELLRPRAYNKSSAQFLFSDPTAGALESLLRAAGVGRLLCCGAPRLLERWQGEALLLDCDQRFEEFWPPERFCLYNMFNHNMFSERGWQVYRDFVQKDGGEGLGVFVDPPFGGRLEALALTLQRVAQDCDTPPAVFLVLPYFNEPDVLKSFPGLHMTDFRVEYDNHGKYTSAAGGRKFGSPVRLFTSLPPARLPLPAPTYRLCAPCRRWVHAENRHCAPCGQCTSKDGRPYRHCDPCGRCVKVTWQHCAACGRCALPDHPCPASGADTTDFLQESEADNRPVVFKRAGKHKENSRRKRQRR